MTWCAWESSLAVMSLPLAIHLALSVPLHIYNWPTAHYPRLCDDVPGLSVAALQLVGYASTKKGGSLESDLQIWCNGLGRKWCSCTLPSGPTNGQFFMFS